MNRRQLENDLIEAPHFESGSKENVDFDGDNCLCGYLYASYKELVQAFGEPTDGDGGYKTNYEWYVQDGCGYTFSIYDYRQEDNPWHIGGDHQLMDFSSLAIFLSVLWKRKVTIVEHKDQKKIEANVVSIKMSILYYKSKTEDIAFIESETL